MDTYPHGDTVWFQHDRFGMFIHWGIYSMAARHEWVQHNEKIPGEDYKRNYADHFDPDLFDAKEWARAAKTAGMKYVVFTTKHHDGFCMFDSKFTDWKVTNTPAGRDIVREVVDAFRAEGLRIGFYYSLLDWHHPDYVLDNRIGPYCKLPQEELDKRNVGRDQHRYAEYIRNQVTELLTNYGKIDILWFDFSYPCAEDPYDATKGKGRYQWEAEELVKLVRKLQPDIIMDKRMDLPVAGDIDTPEQYTPQSADVNEDGSVKVWEGCQTFSGSWGYYRDETSWKSPDQCIKILIDHVALGGNLLMNVGPTSRGYLDYRAMERLGDYAQWMKYNGRSIYGCTFAPGLEKASETRYTYNPKTKRLYVHIYSWPFKELQLPGLAGKVEYAQLLSDGSQIPFREETPESCGVAGTKKGCITLLLPVVKPRDVVPVAELFLKEAL